MNPLVNELTDVLSSWITYCEDTIVNVSKGNLTELRSAQKEIKQEIRRAKLRYKQKVEDKFRNNNLGLAWDSIRTMVGLTDDNVKKRLSLDGFTSDLVLAPELNKFYSRFDVHDFNNEITTVKNTILKGH